MPKFWNWTRGTDGEPELRIEQEITQDTGWWDDSGTTPKAFRAELEEANGADITLWINSPGGDVFAASSIYTSLMEHPGRVTVKIDGIAASAASVIAMAGNTILMSPPSMMMIHNPWTFAMGDAREMERTKAKLEECGAAIVSAYALRTGMDRDKIAAMMNEEKFMSAATAVELGFADGVLYHDEQEGRLAPAACVMTSRGIYAYAGRAREDPMAAARARLVAESRALVDKLRAGK